MVPTNTSGGLGGGNFFKAQAGANKIAILADAIEGYEYWTQDNVAVRSKEKFTETPNIKVRKDAESGEDKEDKQKYFWAVPVYNFNTLAVEVFQITQKGIRDELAALQANESWGDPTGSYTITINKKGEGLLTKYGVTPNPAKKGELDDILTAYKEAPVDLENIFFKEG